MTMNPALPALHDIHLPPAPGWWPPAPGWWALMVLVVGGLAWFGWTRWQARRRVRTQERMLAQFDAALAAVVEPPAKLAAASELLRRAARCDHAAAATLVGEAWLDFLDGADADKPFSRGAGRALLDGAFRPHLNDDATPALELARARFAQLLRGRSAESGHA